MYKNPPLPFQPVVRAQRHFNPLHIPKELQKALPFKSKPKQQQPKGKTPKDVQRPSVIREPHDRKVKVKALSNTAVNVRVSQIIYTEMLTETVLCV